jgi:hypothetical protein
MKEPRTTCTDRKGCPPTTASRRDRSTAGPPGCPRRCPRPRPCERPATASGRLDPPQGAWGPSRIRASGPRSTASRDDERALLLPRETGAASVGDLAARRDAAHASKPGRPRTRYRALTRATLRRQLEMQPRRPLVAMVEPWGDNQRAVDQRSARLGMTRRRRPRSDRRAQLGASAGRIRNGRTVDPRSVRKCRLSKVSTSSVS